MLTMCNWSVFFIICLENVARSSPQQIEIGVQVDVVGESQKLLCVQVLDYGYEVPEQERERIFQSFYSPGSDSNGLGLAICKGIIEAHQGRIWVEALSGGGSCFVFTIPIHPQAATEALSLTSGWGVQPLVISFCKAKPHNHVKLEGGMRDESKREAHSCG